MVLFKPLKLVTIIELTVMKIRKSIWHGLLQLINWFKILSRPIYFVFECSPHKIIARVQIWWMRWPLFIKITSNYSLEVLWLQLLDVNSCVCRCPILHKDSPRQTATCLKILHHMLRNHYSVRFTIKNCVFSEKEWQKSDLWWEATSCLLYTSPSPRD